MAAASQSTWVVLACFVLARLLCLLAWASVSRSVGVCYCYVVIETNTAEVNIDGGGSGSEGESGLRAAGLSCTGRQRR